MFHKLGQFSTETIIFELFSRCLSHNLRQKFRDKNFRKKIVLTDIDDTEKSPVSLAVLPDGDFFRFFDDVSLLCCSFSSAIPLSRKGHDETFNPTDNSLIKLPLPIKINK